MNDLLDVCGYKNWIPVKDGDTRARDLYLRHYSCHHYADGRRSNWSYRNRNLIVGPGEKLVLLSRNDDALFVWRKFISDDGQVGVNCAVFRNESDVLSSLLILEAEEFAYHRWPGERLYTYVNPFVVKSKNPGYCFIVAGWKRCGITKVKKLIVLEKMPLHL